MLDVVMFALVGLFAADTVGMLRFWPLCYSTGPCVFEMRDPSISRPVVWPGKSGNAGRGKFRAVTSHRVLIRERQDPFDLFRSEVRVTMTWEDGSCTTQGRYPLTYCVAAALVVVSLIINSITGREWLQLLLILIVTAGGIAVTVVVARLRARSLSQEFLASYALVKPHA